MLLHVSRNIPTLYVCNVLLARQGILSFGISMLISIAKTQALIRVEIILELFGVSQAI